MKNEHVTERQQVGVSLRLSIACDALDDLRCKRAEMLQRHAKEIGALDNAINQEWAKISSLAVLNRDLSTT